VSRRGHLARRCGRQIVTSASPNGIFCQYWSHGPFCGGHCGPFRPAFIPARASCRPVIVARRDNSSRCVVDARYDAMACCAAVGVRAPSHGLDGLNSKRRAGEVRSLIEEARTTAARVLGGPRESGRAAAARPELGRAQARRFCRSAQEARQGQYRRRPPGSVLPFATHPSAAAWRAGFRRVRAAESWRAELR
jgi:hypothetical protein